MKIQCQECEEIVPIGDFQASAAGIQITCAACGKSFFVRAPSGDLARAATALAGTGADPSDCPKCGRAGARAMPACPSCGLASDRFDAFSRENAPEDGELAQLWSECERAWEDDAAHDRFAGAASRTGSFAAAARRYRAVLQQRPGDAIASARLVRVARMAEAALLANPARARGDKEPEPFKGVVVMLIGLLFLCGIGGVLLYLRSSEGDDARPAGRVGAPRAPEPAPRRPPPRPGAPH